jgi:hypothetical protein
LAGLLVTAGYTGRHPQQFLVAAVGAQPAVDDARFVRRFQHHRAGAVAEQDAGTAILPVDDAGEGVRSDHQRPPRRPVRMKRSGDVHGVDEAGADRLHVEGGAAVTTQTMLQLSGDAGKNMIRRGGAQDDQIDSARLQPRRLQRSAGRLFGQIAGRLIGCGDMALLDSGALDDPVCRGVDQLFEIGVCQHFFRQVAAGSNDSGVVQSACLAA